ncbi:hypothetical protein FA95DRAFT_1608635 [Auriscalpium vulgare]|uniref:Uncharacterized protein n=1 Tax=Auriscalpium vulgare TaxID=40419 RepID=A0ACB8RJR1_9AGAM|nr:hypothetical protein FA95DRAFT_1608635 [Auriscalpium vulgare]
MASNPTPQTLHDIGYQILQKYARAPRPSDPDDIDGVLHNTRLLMRDLLLFRTLHEGVKSGDFGRPEELFGIFTLFFCGAGARNYCAEFLHFLQNMHMVWTPDFANVMRDNMLINMSGRGDIGPVSMRTLSTPSSSFSLVSKQFYVSRGVRASWDELSNISPASHIFASLKKTFRTTIGVGYKGLSHTDPDTSPLVRRVAKAAAEWSLLTRAENLPPRTVKKRTVDAYLTGLERMGQSSKNPLKDFHMKRRKWLEQGVVMEPEEDDIAPVVIVFEPETEPSSDEV